MAPLNLPGHLRVLMCDGYNSNSLHRRIHELDAIDDCERGTLCLCIGSGSTGRARWKVRAGTGERRECYARQNASDAF